MEGIIKVTPDKEKAKSIFKMANSTLRMIRHIDYFEFSSNVVVHYYDVIRELMSVVLLLDGYKTIGESSHKRLIEYIKENCNEFSLKEISLIDELRRIRNKISYDGFFVDKDFIEMRLTVIIGIIKKLKAIIKNYL